MKLHLPAGLRRAVYDSILAVLIAGAAMAPAYAAYPTEIEYDGVTYGKGSTASISGTVIENGKEAFVSLSGDKYYTSFNMGNAHQADFVPSTEETREDAQGFAQIVGHTLVAGKVTIQSDSFVQVAEGHSLNATGRSVTIGTEGVDLQFMDPIKRSTYTAPIYGGVLSFYKTDTTHTDNVRTLTVGSLQTYMGAYVNDLKTFIVDSTKVAVTKSTGAVTVTPGEQTHYATSSDDMDVRRNSDVNGYILTDISGNDITIVKGDFSLDTDKTQNMDAEGNVIGELNYDKMNTGDYGYVQSLKIGVSADGATAGTSTVKALNDLQVVDGITIADGSKLNMNQFALETKSLSGQVTGVSKLTVGDFTRLTPADTVADFEHNEQGRQGEKDPAVYFEAELATTTASASVTGGTMDVTGDGKGTYTVNGASADSTVVLEKGDFVLAADNAKVEVKGAGFAISDNGVTGADIALSNGSELVITEQTKLTGTVKLVDKTSSVTMTGGSSLNGVTLDGNSVGALTLHGYTGSIEGVKNLAVINLVLGSWDTTNGPVDMSKATGAVIDNFTLNIDFAAWNADVEYDAGAQMTLVTGLHLTDAQLATITTTLSTPALLTASEEEAASETPAVTGVAVTFVKNGDTYDVVATQTIPEPTTAALSLLALAGLAARRRRK